MADGSMAQWCQPIQLSEFFAEDRRFTGIYFLYRKGVLVYVGQSRTIQWRIDQHLQDGVKRFDQIAFIRCGVKELDRLEQKFIRRYAPEYNNCALANKARREASWQPLRLRAFRKPRWGTARRTQAKLLQA